MASTHREGSNSHANTQGNRSTRGPDISVINRLERPVEEWDAADGAQRLMELRAARNHTTPEPYSESEARFIAFRAQKEQQALTQYHALQNDSNICHGSVQSRTRPLDSHFGSDGNQYNPYAPLSSGEYMLQEIEAGRMDPEMMDMPQNLSNSAQSPSPGNAPSQLLAHIYADGRSSWIAQGHGPPNRQTLNGRGLPHALIDPHEASWFRNPYTRSTSVDDLREAGYTDNDSAPHPYLNHRIPPSTSNNSYYTQYPLLPNHGNSLLNPGQVTSSRNQSTLSENCAAKVPQKPNLASTGRGKKRLAKPSLVVKLKTPSAQKTLQALASPKRSRADAPLSSESNSAAGITHSPRHFILRSKVSGGPSSTDAQSPAGWQPQAVQKPTRRAEAIQNSQRKRRRHAVSPQDDVSTAPTAGLPQGKVI